MDRIDKEGNRLPIKIDSTSNGEYEPIPISPINERANKLALQLAGENARRSGQSRRKFLISSCGAASTLLAFNQANAYHHKRGGFFDIREESALDASSALAEVEGGEFIFDVQGHYVNPEGDWLSRIPPAARPYAGMEKAACDAGETGGDRGYLNCLSGNEFIKDIFLDSDTDIMVLSFVPSTRENEPVTIEDATETRNIVAQLQGSKRLLVHGRVNPNQDGDLEGMDELAENWDIAAFKTYTQYGPGGIGFYLHDDPGLAMIERARRLGVRNICVHKGLPFGPRSYEHSQCQDIGIVAKLYPDMNFLVYHSGFVASVQEQEFIEGAGRDGIDTLIQSVLDNEVAPNSNVYAELGSTWRFLMRDPDNAAHALGKLFKYIGEDNVLWGTDSIWYGSPQDQIQAFRTFQISQEFQDRYGYSAISPAMRRKVFGLNAALPYQIDEAEIRALTANDFVASEKLAYQQDPQPSFLTHGPKTRREFMNFLKWGSV
ncbi:MAG TPA: amidohydrolase [Gammaproteobacteria bacterium]|jgi:predicted TIM-barrel fold metal-dependent hydrolase|nr:amidohydrolase [Gammaproteobacteria bacterium]HAT26705.1 amidohydrolase [Gammaproteobacteria bacterium]HIF88141.1 amidohydrolase [Gammaproteobacteria bacterium]HIL62092.1 amidohydrolase [Porticoccaceae bacterium]